jgi:RNA polymerase-binding protein DksA
MARSGSKAAATTSGAGSTKGSGTAAKTAAKGSTGKPAGAKKISAASSSSVKPRSTATGTAKASGPAAKKPVTKAVKSTGKAAAKTASKGSGRTPATGATKSPASNAAKSTAKSTAKGTAGSTASSSGKKPVKTTAKNGPARKTPATAKTAKTAKAGSSGGRASRPSRSRLTLAVKDDETPWTAQEIAEVRGELSTDRDRLRSELNLAEEELADLMRDAGDGAGNDQADVGSTTFERDHEMSLANNARVMLAQTERALGRLDDGSYGVCESCGQPIGKNRLMAFPRATLCLSCKQREERR